MYTSEIQKYARLNEIADQGGIVIFGCGKDKEIPIGELRQAFSVESKVYNRSFDRLSVGDAVYVYQQSVAPLNPETVLIHIGEADRNLFAANPSEFDQQYRGLISFIRLQDKRCRIVVVALKNYDRDPLTDDLNRHLRYIADSEGCEYGDIAARRVWNPKATLEATSFMHSIGFSMIARRPLYDLVKILFCCEA